MKIAIIGAGPAGLAAAYALTKKGIRVDIYENRQQVGGLSASIDLWGQKVELGPHYLLKHTDEPVQRLIHEQLTESEVYHYKRLTRIYQKNKFIHYPPTPLTILQNLGIKNAVLTFFALCNPFVKQAPVFERSFETYIKKNVGTYIYKNFFQEYTEKLWGIPGNEINDEYAQSLIGVGNLSFTALLRKVFRPGGSRNNTDCIYPKGGMSMLWEALKKTIETQGGVFHLSADIKSITADETIAIELSTGESKQYDYIISTIPEITLLHLLHDAGTKKLLHLIKKLKYRNAILVYLKIEDADFMTDNNIYIYSKAIKCIRITNYNRFKNLEGNDIIMLEYWTNENDSMWNISEEEVLEIVQGDLCEIAKDKKIKFLNSKIIRLKNAFPVPDHSIRRVKDAIDNHLKSYSNLIRTGRSNQDRFNYGMEDALRDGLLCAANILKQLPE